jgi:hypothetical protein
VVQVLRSTGAAFEAPATVLDQPVTMLDLTGARLVAGELDDTRGPDLAIAGGTSLYVVPRTAATPAFGSPETWYSSGGFDTMALLDLAAGDVDGDNRADIVLADTGTSGMPRLRLAASTGQFFGARDPTVAELRFMWISALAHGSAGIVAWGQEFTGEADVAWPRLARVAREFHELTPHLAGTTASFASASGRTVWWVSSIEDVLHLVVINETRRTDATGVSQPLLPGRPGSSVELWDPEAREFGAVVDVIYSSRTVVDRRPLGPYEARIYRVLP